MQSVSAVVFLSLLTVVSAKMRVTCSTCMEDNCNNGKAGEEECPMNQGCYTVKSRVTEKVIQKGCASTCDFPEGTMGGVRTCVLCAFDRCNAEDDDGLLWSRRHGKRSLFNRNHHGNEIGGGASPYSQGGVGQGAQPYHNNPPSVGGGASPNNHGQHHQQGYNPYETGNSHGRGRHHKREVRAGEDMQP